MKKGDSLLFYGMMRSGNHAIIHWIAKAITNISLEPKFDTKIYTSGDNLVFFNDVSRTKHYIRSEISKYKDYDYILAGVEDKYTSKENLIIKNLLKDPTLVFIFRDPKDCYKSRKKMFGSSELFLENFLNRYGILLKMYSRKLMGLNKPVMINYDKWNDSQEYRKEILVELGIPVTDQNLNKPDKIKSGPGTSSFSDQNKNKLTPEEIEKIENFVGSL